jgi:ubiquinone/menaquinone biosynthesis C-methylase UbiE
MQALHLGMFSALDEAPDPAFFVQMMDRLEGLPDVLRCRERAREALRLEPGHRLLDVGCGTGQETRAGAGLVTPGGSAVGVDFSETMVTEARRRTAGTGLPVSFEVGDVGQLRFDDGTFDACRTERMLSHVSDPAAALAEMLRVTRPGGRLAVIDADVAGTLFDHRDEELTASFVASLARLRHPTMGRRLLRLLGEAGAGDVTVEPVLARVTFGAAEPLLAAHAQLVVEAGGVDAERAERWLADLEYAHLAGRFFLAMAVVVATGRKP